MAKGKKRQQRRKTVLFWIDLLILIATLIAAIIKIVILVYK
jgi:hypothetical protein